MILSRLKNLLSIQTNIKQKNMKINLGSYWLWWWFISIHRGWWRISKIETIDWDEERERESVWWKNKWQKKDELLNGNTKKIISIKHTCLIHLKKKEKPRKNIEESKNALFFFVERTIDHSMRWIGLDRKRKWKSIMVDWIFPIETWFLFRQRQQWCLIFETGIGDYLLSMKKKDVSVE